MEHEVPLAVLKFLLRGSVARGIHNGLVRKEHDNTMIIECRAFLDNFRQGKVGRLFPFMKYFAPAISQVKGTG